MEKRWYHLYDEAAVSWAITNDNYYMSGLREIQAENLARMFNQYVTLVEELK